MKKLFSIDSDVLTNIDISYQLNIDSHPIYRLLNMLINTKQPFTMDLVSFTP